MAEPLRALQAAARLVGETQADAGVRLDDNAEEMSVEDFVAQFKPALMDIVYKWCNRAPFREVMEASSLFEGTVIRAVRRLDELLGQLARAAVAVGDTALKAKFEEAAGLLRHGLMFSNSLYL